MSHQPVSLERLIWLLWLHFGLGLPDPVESGRARLAWEYGLSREEIRLVELIAAGLTNDEIVQRLQLAEVNTVKNRVKKLFEKLGVDRRVAVGTIAARFGLIPRAGAPSQTNE